MNAVTEFEKHCAGAFVPTSPGDGGVAVGVLFLDAGAGIEKHLDRFFRAIRGGAVERGFAFGAAIAHEGSGFAAGNRFAVGVSAVL